MNAILSRVESLRGDGRLERFALGKSPSCVLLTPRFRTSRHVVALLIPTGAGEPKLVVKMPRLAGDDDGIAREARVLTSLREKEPIGERVDSRGRRVRGRRPAVLVETALVGPLDDPPDASCRSRALRRHRCQLAHQPALQPPRRDVVRAAHRRAAERFRRILPGSGRPSEISSPERWRSSNRSATRRCPASSSTATSATRT